MDPARGMLATHQLQGPGLRLVVADGVPLDWARDAWRLVGCFATAGCLARFELPLPDEGAYAVVKPCTPRTWWPPGRRLMPCRAVREGRGLVEVSRWNLPAVPLLFWGEERFAGLVRYGAVATRRLDAPPCHEAWRQSGDPAILEGVVDELAALHAAGLAHGDAALRNWLWTPPRPTVLDLASWSRLNPSTRARDLLRLLASILWVTGSTATARQLLGRYSSRELFPLADPESLLRQAAERAAAKGRG